MGWLKDLFGKKEERREPTGAILRAIKLENEKRACDAWANCHDINMMSNKDLVKKLYRHTFTNQRLKEAFDRASSFGLHLIIRDKFDIREGCLDINGNASDDEIIKFILGE
jgi:hypothetical protein